MSEGGRHFGGKACQACAEVRRVRRAWRRALSGHRDEEETNWESFMLSP